MSGEDQVEEPKVHSRNGSPSNTSFLANITSIAVFLCIISLVPIAVILYLFTGTTTQKPKHGVLGEAEGFALCESVTSAEDMLQGGSPGESASLSGLRLRY
jgi:hypothetical protein